MPLETFYLPSEAVNYINYPELRTAKPDIEAIMEYAMRVNLAVADYDEARFDRIDVNMEEVQRNIELCRRVCETLGTAPKVCFDILLDIRDIQNTLQNLVYLKRTTGNSIIDTPTITTEGDI